MAEATYLLTRCLMVSFLWLGLTKVSQATAGQKSLDRPNQISKEITKVSCYTVGSGHNRLFKAETRAKLPDG